MATTAQRMIFHHPGVLDPAERPSASQIRPSKMLSAFQSQGYEVDVVMGDVKERGRQIRDIIRAIKGGEKYLFLYSESSTMPTLLTTRSRLPLHPRLDYRLFRFVKKAGIPAGVFYRDIYWRFPDYRKTLGWAKSSYARFFHYVDLWIYERLFDVVFVPSLEMLDHLPRRFRLHGIALPSGTTPDATPCPRYSGGPLHILYVGGIRGCYDLSDIYSAVMKLPNCRLTVCCREGDWGNCDLKNRFDDEVPENVQIVHLAGNALEELYSQAHVLALTAGRHQYRDFGMPFKLFEYIAHRGPIICTAGTAAANFVEEKGAGIIVDDSPEAIRRALEEIIHSPGALNPIYQNLETLASSESWAERAMLVARSLRKCQG